MSRFKKLSKVRCQQPLVCWHGSVAFPILPIHIANLFRLSRCTLPIMSIPKPLKLSDSQISYPIWQMSIPDVCVTREIIRYSNVPIHSWTVMGDDMQWHCSDAFIQIKWVLFHIAMYRPSGCNRIFCVAVSTELRRFEMPSLPVDNVACCACARFPDGALGKIIAARKHQALAGCKCEGAVCICKTIFLDLVFYNKWTIRAQERWVILLSVYMCVHISIYLNS